MKNVTAKLLIDVIPDKPVFTTNNPDYIERELSYIKSIQLAQTVLLDFAADLLSVDQTERDQLILEFFELKNQLADKLNRGLNES